MNRAAALCLLSVCSCTMPAFTPSDPPAEPAQVTSPVSPAPVASSGVDSGVEPGQDAEATEGSELRAADAAPPSPESAAEAWAPPPTPPPTVTCTRNDAISAQWCGTSVYRAFRCPAGGDPESAPGIAYGCVLESHSEPAPYPWVWCCSVVLYDAG